MGFGMAPRRCGIHSKPQPLLQKTCIFHASETLAAYAGICLRTQVVTLVRGPRATLVIYFHKYIFVNLKSDIFHFNSPQVNLIDWTLNWP